VVQTTKALVFDLLEFILEVISLVQLGLLRVHSSPPALEELLFGNIVGFFSFMVQTSNEVVDVFNLLI
jgi:hypothetical protein